MRQTRRKRHQSRKIKRSGGAILGKGTFGVVFRPPLLCDPPRTEQTTENQVGKVQDREQEENEIQVSESLKILDPDMDQTIPILASCALAETQTNLNQKQNMNRSFNNSRNNHTVSDYTKQKQQIISKQGGPNAQEWLEDHFLLPTPSISQRVQWSIALYHFFRALKDFLPFLQAFNQFWIHNDLHLRNLVQDGERIRMIDFGITESRDEVANRLQMKMNKNMDKINRRLDMLDVSMLQNDLREFLKEKPHTARLTYPLRVWLESKFAQAPITAEKIQDSLFALPE